MRRRWLSSTRRVWRFTGRLPTPTSKCFGPSSRPLKVHCGTSLAINGGAAVALLALLGHLTTSGGATASIPAFASPLLLFAWGVLSAAVASGFAYITQACFSCAGRKTGWVFNVLSVALVIASYVCFGVASLGALDAFVIPPAVAVPP